jgi:hypothetical protein
MASTSKVTLILLITAATISMAVVLIFYQDFSSKEKAKQFAKTGKKEEIRISSKQAEDRYSMWLSRKIRKRTSYTVSGFIDTADNSKFGVRDPNCQVELSKSQFCLPDFSAGFKINLVGVDMTVSEELYESLKEGDSLEAYCLEEDGKPTCMPAQSIHSILN